MVNKFCVVGCRSNYKEEETVPAFSFPSDENIKNRWIKFVNRKDWQSTSSIVICIKHFEGKFLRKGEHEKRFKLIKTLKPIPTIYPALQKHRPHVKYLFQENPQRKEFFKNISKMNLKGTTTIDLESITE